ncbi:two component transcriptional regulator, winged helix family [Malonomonas rubra DSM 5091]|uniref:Two component transcriptional regulator, winged helix family n=1 Tax=Malonomonas rubra DSM 5091 TaxID=1122189 RepID=A0A1M6EWI8_MALRU|nr:response regulator transcription factor [Malonomonas rubra]SHI89731.1 two component transcriptional regulator, winged helix family [Malonomonas rubra DSM 5091]
MHILVIDDGPEIRQLLTDYLTPEGFTVETVADGVAGLERSLSGEHAFVILDVQLPRMDGFEILRKIREKSDIPILMLTICSEHEDRVRGLKMGADDYLNKPFNLQELLARINTIMRRCANNEIRPNGKPGSLRVGDLLLNPGSRRVYRDDEEICLTAAEFTLLEVLLTNAGEVIPREELVRRVQGRSHNPYDRSLDVHISHLRKKLSPHRDGSDRIKAVRGVGHFYTLPTAVSSEPEKV